MVNITFDESFKKTIVKLQKTPLSEKIKKQISKIVHDPTCGKPMRYGRKGTRELYIKPFRISYVYNQKNSHIIFLEIYHKNDQ
ncbi:MAG: type II toxin-antitoxin system RelE family toxin [Candidatus Woesearchaeota archaeon]